MGYITTLSIYNDGINLIKENAQDFADKIYKTTTDYRNKSTELPLGNFSNLIKVQKTRHADDKTIYAHIGNTVVEMNPNSEETKDLMKRNPEFFKRVVGFLENQIEEIKKLK